MKHIVFEDKKTRVLLSVQGFEREKNPNAQTFNGNLTYQDSSTVSQRTVEHLFFGEYISPGIAKYHKAVVKKNQNKQMMKKNYRLLKNKTTQKYRKCISKRESKKHLLRDIQSMIK